GEPARGCEGEARGPVALDQRGGRVARAVGGGGGVERAALRDFARARAAVPAEAVDGVGVVALGGDGDHDVELLEGFEAGGGAGASWAMYQSMSPGSSFSATMGLSAGARVNSSLCSFVRPQARRDKSSSESARMAACLLAGGRHRRGRRQCQVLDELSILRAG